MNENAWCVGRSLMLIYSRQKKRTTLWNITSTLDLFMELFHCLGTSYHKDFLTLLLSVDTVPNFFLCLKVGIYGIKIFYGCLSYGFKEEHSASMLIIIFIFRMWLYFSKNLMLLTYLWGYWPNPNVLD